MGVNFVSNKQTDIDALKSEPRDQNAANGHGKRDDFPVGKSASDGGIRLRHNQTASQT